MRAKTKQKSKSTAVPELRLFRSQSTFTGLWGHGGKGVVERKGRTSKILVFFEVCQGQYIHLKV